MNHILHRACFMFLVSISLISNTCAHILEIKNEQEFNTIIQSKPAVIEFWASWCSVCQSVKKPFEEVANDPEFAQVTFARIEISENNSLSKKMDIMGVPTFVYFNDGKKIYQSVGIHDLKSFAQEIRKTIHAKLLPTQNDSSLATTDASQESDELIIIEMPEPEEDDELAIESENDSFVYSEPKNEDSAEEPIDATNMRTESEEEIIDISSLSTAVIPSAEELNEAESAEELDLLDNFTEPTFFEWIVEIIKAFLNTTIDIILWLPRTIIGLFNLFFK